MYQRFLERVGGELYNSCTYITRSGGWILKIIDNAFDFISIGFGNENTLGTSRLHKMGNIITSFWNFTYICEKVIQGVFNNWFINKSIQNVKFYNRWRQTVPPGHCPVQKTLPSNIKPGLWCTQPNRRLSELRLFYRTPLKQILYRQIIKPFKNLKTSIKSPRNIRV